MPIKCKCCNSSNLELINKMIIEGLTFQDISKKLYDLNESISAISINRHAIAHIEGYHRENKNNKVSADSIVFESSFLCDKEQVLDDLGLSDSSYGSVILSLIESITVEIATSCYVELKLHNEGKSRFPKDKFMALKDSLLMQSKVGTDPYKYLSSAQSFNLQYKKEESKKIKLELNKKVSILGLGYGSIEFDDLSEESLQFLLKKSFEEIRRLKSIFDDFDLDSDLIYESQNISLIEELLNKSNDEIKKDIKLIKKSLV